MDNGRDTTLLAPRAAQLLRARILYECKRTVTFRKTRSIARTSQRSLHPESSSLRVIDDPVGTRVRVTALIKGQVVGVTSLRVSSSVREGMWTVKDSMASHKTALASCSIATKTIRKSPAALAIHRTG